MGWPNFFVQNLTEGYRLRYSFETHKYLAIKK